MENRNGLVVGAALTEANGSAERDTALHVLQHRRSERPTRKRWTVGGDKGYDTKDFMAGCRALAVTPHVAQHSAGRRSAIDHRTTRHVGYAVSQQVRKRVEEIFGWKKTVGGGRKLRYIGRRRNENVDAAHRECVQLGAHGQPGAGGRVIPRLGNHVGAQSAPQKLPLGLGFPSA
jgi:hypothetical protein